MKPNIFATKDVNLAAYIQTQGFPVIEAKRERGQVVFRFDLGPEVQRDLNRSWITGTGEVAARGYADTLKAMKAWLFHCDESEDDSGS